MLILVQKGAITWPSACTDPGVKPNTPYWLVATDLDGTLLDAEYDHAQAAAAVDTLSDAANAQVVLASSKTVAEMVDLADRCESNPLLLFENGTGLAWRTSQLPLQGGQSYLGYQVDSVATARDYQSLRDQLQIWRHAHGFGFRGFGDLSSGEIAELTGLSSGGADLARRRLYTEPLIWDDSEEQLLTFTTLLEQNGLRLLAGGRFLHVMPQTDKADGLARLSQMLTKAHGRAQGLVACGDAPNDLSMLQSADLAVVFPDPEGGYLLPESAAVRHACMAGPTAWLSCLTRLLTTASVTNQRITPQ